MADTPTRDDARIPLFLAAASVRSDQFARGVIEPLLRAQFQRSVGPVAITEDESFTETAAMTTEGIPNWLSTSLRLSPVQQSQIAWTLAEVLIRTNQLSQALSYLQITDRLETVTTRRHQVANKIAAVRLQLRRHQRNEARQPILHEALEQDRLVHTKLPLPTQVAGSAPPVKAADKKSVSR